MSVMVAGLYARVSTRDKGQDVENQLRQLRAFAEKENWAIVEYIDHVSGGKGETMRPNFARMLRDARDGRIKMVLFWALDRFSREGALPTLSYLERLTEYGCAWKSLTEQYLDSAGIFRDAVIAIIAVMAKQERVRRRERVMAGLDLAKSRGVRLGREANVYTRVELDTLRAAGKVFEHEDRLVMARKNKPGQYRFLLCSDEIHALKSRGLSLAKIAAQVGTSKSQVKRILDQVKEAA